jgi:hypothetical protein
MRFKIENPLINRENPFLNKSVDFIDIKNPEEIEEIDS